jgi:hypothetical protein
MNNKKFGGFNKLPLITDKDPSIDDIIYFDDNFEMKFTDTFKQWSNKYK